MNGNHGMSRRAAQDVYEMSGYGPNDVQVIELHDCFSANELLLYEALGLCGEGEAPKLIDDNDTTYGAEAAVQFGPFGAQAEYMVLDGENTAGVGFDASGYYVDVYWSLTGESRNYRGNQGSFAAIAPRRSLADGGPGHWMVSARYDYIDLSDDLFTAGQRGEQSAWAAGLDWVPVDHVRFKLNYASTDMERAAGADTSADVITLRTQFDF